MEKPVVATGGITLSELLTVVFIALKLAGYITWSWWWIFAPLWIPLAIGLVVLLVASLIYMIVGMK